MIAHFPYDEQENQNKKETAGKTEEGIRKMKSILLVLNRKAPPQQRLCHYDRKSSMDTLQSYHV